MRTSLRIASALAASAVLVGGLTACSSKSGGGSDAKGGASAAASAGASAASAGASAGASGGPGSAAGGGVQGLGAKEALLASAAVMDKAGTAKLTVKGANAEDGGTGTIVWKSPGSFQLAAKVQGQEFKVIMVGDALYGGAPEQLAALAGGKQWMKIDAKSGDKPGAGAADAGSYGLMAQMLNPAVQLLVAAPTATKVGAEKVDGADTVHFRSAVPVDTLSAAMTLSADLKAKAVEQLKKGGSSVTVELWIDAKGELVQISGAQLGLGGDTTVKYSELGTAAAPKAPAADQVFDLAELIAKGGH